MTEEKEDQPQFDWPTYLAQTDSVAAPASCFFQAPEPPVNNFEEGTSVEAYDSRYPTITCVGIVTGKFGPKVRIRMIGAGANDDFWAMCDSKQIRPVGTADHQGTMLQPPFNCQQDGVRWAKLLKATLQNTKPAPSDCFQPEPQRPLSNMFKVGWKLEASDTKDPTYVCAATVRELCGDKVKVEFDGWNMFDKFRYDSRDIYPAGWWAKSGAKFQPPPSSQKKAKRSSNSSTHSQHSASSNSATTSHVKNTVGCSAANSEFSINDAITSVINKELFAESNINDSISSVIAESPPPAPISAGTVTSSDNNKSSSMVNLFETANHILTCDIPPANEAPSEEKLKLHIVNGSISNESSISPKVYEKSLMNGKPTAPVKHKARKTVGAVGGNPILSASSSSNSSNSDSSTLILSAGKISPSIINGGVSPKIKQSSEQKNGPVSSKNCSAAATKSTQSTSTIYRSPDSSESAAYTKWTIPQSPGVTEVKSINEFMEATEFVVYLNAPCASGKWLDPSKLRRANSRYGPGSVNHVMRSCLQMLVDCASDQSHVLSAIPVGDGHASVSADIDGSTRIVRLPYFRSILDAWKYLTVVLDNLQTCPHLISKKFDSCMSCESVASSSFSKKRKISSTIDALSLDISGSSSSNRKRHVSGESSSSTCTEKDSGLLMCNDISKWTVDDVARFVFSVADTSSADLFRKQEIDGKALLLLTPDMMIRYMNVRLGPALKIGNAIERLKSTCGGSNRRPISDH